jgi:hypothetical protein
MRARHLLLLASLAGAAAGCGDSGAVTGSAATEVDISVGRSVLVDGVTFIHRDGSVVQAEGAPGGVVRGWASPALSGQGYPMGVVPASGYEALWMLQRPGFQGRLEAIAFSPRCTFSRWVIGLNTVSTSAYIALGNYPGINSFVAEFVCTA